MRKLAVAALVAAALAFAVPGDPPERCGECDCECTPDCGCLEGGECTCGDDCGCADSCSCSDDLAYVCKPVREVAAPCGAGGCGGCGSR